MYTTFILRYCVLSVNFIIFSLEFLRRKVTKMDGSKITPENGVPRKEKNQNIQVFVRVR